MFGNALTKKRVPIQPPPFLSSTISWPICPGMGNRYGGSSFSWRRRGSWGREETGKGESALDLPQGVESVTGYRVIQVLILWMPFPPIMIGLHQRPFPSQG